MGPARPCCRPPLALRTAVLSAVSGLSVAVPSLSQELIVGVAIAVLIFVFALQPLGTGKVGKFCTGTPASPHVRFAQFSCTCHGDVRMLVCHEYMSQLNVTITDAGVHAPSLIGT